MVLQAVTNLLIGNLITLRQRPFRHFTVTDIRQIRSPQGGHMIHSFRHGWASQLARGTSLRVVQQLLGHRFLGSTEVYLHNQPEDMVQALASLPVF